jgi:hypothetical protein
VRKAINDNPVVQVAVIGVLAIGVAFMLLSRMGGGGSSSPASSSTTTPVAAAGTVTPAAPSTAATTPSATTPLPSAPSTAAPATETKFTAGRGLPAPVVKAYDGGKTVVLLVIRRGGIDDRIMKSITEKLRSRNDLAVFVIPARHVAQYSRITQGVDLNRVPALVVLRPRRLSRGPLPKASISYGFRSADSVLQAVDDAAYRGANNLPYYPK